MSKQPQGMSKQTQEMEAADVDIAARKVLLDALDALESHIDAITVVGAQAVALRTAIAELALPSYTFDADLSIDPSVLGPNPLLQEAMISAGFTRGEQPGAWQHAVHVGDQVANVDVDLMVGDTFSEKGGRRGGRIPPHAANATRKASGLEPSAVDADVMQVTSLDGNDGRLRKVRVAGPAALLVAKAFKLHDRATGAREHRLSNKDAADVYRLMVASQMKDVANRFDLLFRNDRTRPTAQTGLDLLQQQFGRPNAFGIGMTQSALQGSVDANRISALAPAFIHELARRVTNSN